MTNTARILPLVFITGFSLLIIGIVGIALTAGDRSNSEVRASEAEFVAVIELGEEDSIDVVVDRLEAAGLDVVSTEKVSGYVYVVSILGNNGLTLADVLEIAQIESETGVLLDQQEDSEEYVTIIPSSPENQELVEEQLENESVVGGVIIAPATEVESNTSSKNEQEQEESGQVEDRDDSEVSDPVPTPVPEPDSGTPPEPGVPVDPQPNPITDPGVIVNPIGFRYGGVENSIYVSPTGESGAIGSLTDPVPDLESALEIVAAGAEGSVFSIYLLDGEHLLTNTVTINSETTAGKDLEIQAFPNANVDVTGGERITGWTNVGADVWEIDASAFVDSAGHIRQVFADGERLLPNFFTPPTGDFLVVKESAANQIDLVFNVNLPEQLGNSPEYVNFTKWSIAIVPIAERLNTDAIRLAEKNSIHGPGTWAEVVTGMKGYIANIPLSQTSLRNVWHHDRATNKLQVRLQPGQDPNSADLRIPQLGEAIDINGAERVAIRDLNFKYFAGWELPNLTEGKRAYYGHQAGIFLEEYVAESGLRLRPLVPETEAQSFGASRVAGNTFAAMAPVVAVSGSRDIAIERNTFSDIGGTGIIVNEQSSNIDIARNKFDSIGAGCVYVGDTFSPSYSTSLIFERDDRVTENVDITNNEISRCGEISSGSVGIWQAYSRNVVIINNTITDMPYSGISSGWTWGNGEGAQRNVRIFNNYIENVMRVMFDGGFIYTLGNSPNSEISNNYLIGSGVDRLVSYTNDVQGVKAIGMYFDQGSTSWAGRNNVVLRVEDPNRYLFFNNFPPGEGALAVNNDVPRNQNFFNREDYPASIREEAGIRVPAGPEFTRSEGLDFNDYFFADFDNDTEQDVVAIASENTDSGSIEVKVFLNSDALAFAAEELVLPISTKPGLDIHVVDYDYTGGENSIVVIDPNGDSGNVELTGIEGPDYDSVSWEITTELPNGDHEFDIYDLGEGSGQDIFAVRTADTVSGNLELSILGQLNEESEGYLRPYYTQELPYSIAGEYQFLIHDYGLDSGDDLVIFSQTDTGVTVDLLARFEMAFEGEEIEGFYSDIYFSAELPNYRLEFSSFAVGPFVSDRNDLGIINSFTERADEFAIEVYSRDSAYSELAFSSSFVQTSGGIDNIPDETAGVSNRIWLSFATLGLGFIFGGAAVYAWLRLRNKVLK